MAVRRPTKQRRRREEEAIIKGKSSNKREGCRTEKYLQVGEFVRAEEGGRLDACDFIPPEVQMLQLGQLLE